MIVPESGKTLVGYSLEGLLTALMAAKLQVGTVGVIDARRYERRDLTDMHKEPLAKAIPRCRPQATSISHRQIVRL